MRYFVVAEIGINHLGSMSLAERMIQAAEEAGADAVKFQYYHFEDIEEDVDRSLVEKVKQYQFSLEQLGLLRENARTLGLGWVCTPFKRRVRISELATLKPDAIKIRYRDFDLGFVEAALKSGVPLVMVSCPAPPIERMDLYYHQQARWLYCIPKYPPEPQDFDAARCGGFDGFSDHYPHITASLLAASLTRGSARTGSATYIIEKHVMFDRETVLPLALAFREPYPDESVSITFKQLRELVRHLRLMEKLRPADNLYSPTARAPTIPAR